EEARRRAARRPAGARPVVDPLPERIHARRPESQGRRVLPRGRVLLPAPRGEDAGGEAMAMRTTSPWWVSLVFGIGLFFTFLGERLLASVDGIHEALTGAGVILVFASTAARGWSFSSSRGNRRRVELTLLACQLAGVAAILIYTLTTGWGPD